MHLTPTTNHTQRTSAYAISNLANGTLVSEAMPVAANTSFPVNAYLHGEMDSVGSEGNWQINACFYKFDGTPSSCSILASGNAPAANWTQVSGTVTSPADAATMKLELVGTQLSGWLAWDDVSVSLDAQMITKYYYAGSQRVAVRKNGVLNYLLGDHLGSASVVTDAGGSLLSKMLYKPWGETRYSSGVMPTDRLYTGQIAEPNLGLYFYNARWYDPALGRFAQADTIIPQPGNPQSWDRYAYTLNSPLMYTDPSGNFTEDAISDYLMGYFEGDEEAALRTLQLWKQNTAWWKMISAAQGGDELTGYFWKTWGDNPRRPCGGDSKYFTAKFIGIGVDFLAGTRGYDLVRLQSREYDGWNVGFKEFTFGPTILFGIGFSGGQGASLDGGIEFLFSESPPGGDLSVYSYHGAGNSSGSGGNLSFYFGAVYGLNDPSDYIGAATTVSGTLSYIHGITGGHFYNYPSRSVNGWFIGYAPGARFSLAQFDNYYDLIWSSP